MRKSGKGIICTSFHFLQIRANLWPSDHLFDYLLCIFSFSKMHLGGKKRQVLSADTRMNFWSKYTGKLMCISLIMANAELFKATTEIG